MDEELRKRNRRMLIALLIFAVLLTLLVLAWKLSIYQKA
jgi:DNA-binding transcriptional regulator of glucitol operon